MVYEYSGGPEITKEQGFGPDTFNNPCLNLGVENVTVTTTSDVVDSLGPGSVDSYDIITKSWNSYGNGELRWFEQSYYGSGGLGSRTDATCGRGNRGNGKCLNDQECCSPWGWCGVTLDHCGVGCLGGPCYKSRTVPKVLPSDFTYCGESQIGFGLCANSGECCTRFGWCGTNDDHCGAKVCLSGPCKKHVKKKKK